MTITRRDSLVLGAAALAGTSLAGAGLATRARAAGDVVTASVQALPPIGQPLAATRRPAQI